MPERRADLRCAAGPPPPDFARPNVVRDRDASSATATMQPGANNLLLDERQVAMLAHEGRTQRNSPDGRDGTAFRETRKPSWYSPAHPNV